MNRWTLAGAAAAALTLWAITGELPPLGAARATRADCVDVNLWDNGWHTSFALAADVLAPEHPLRRYYPGARYFLIGWGDDAFYRSDGNSLWKGLVALAPGGATVMHVIPGMRPVEQSFIPAELVSLGVSRAGARQLGAAIADALATGPDGQPIVVALGRHGPASRFFKGRGEFDLFTVCNHWVARSLRRAGVDVNAAFVYRGDWLAWQVRRAAPSCAALREEKGRP